MKPKNVSISTRKIVHHMMWKYRPKYFVLMLDGVLRVIREWTEQINKNRSIRRYKKENCDLRKKRKRNEGV